jgi:hypothetical protein
MRAFDPVKSPIIQPNGFYSRSFQSVNRKPQKSFSHRFRLLVNNLFLTADTAAGIERFSMQIDAVKTEKRSPQAVRSRHKTICRRSAKKIDRLSVNSQLSNRSLRRNDKSL